MRTACRSQRVHNLNHSLLLNLVFRTFVLPDSNKIVAASAQPICAPREIVRLVQSNHNFEGDDDGAIRSKSTG